MASYLVKNKDKFTFTLPVKFTSDFQVTPIVFSRLESKTSFYFVIDMILEEGPFLVSLFGTSERYVKTKYIYIFFSTKVKDKFVPVL
jgi:hypothetical protein